MTSDQRREQVGLEESTSCATALERSLLAALGVRSRRRRRAVRAVDRLPEDGVELPLRDSVDLPSGRRFESAAQGAAGVLRFSRSTWRGCASTGAELSGSEVKASYIGVARASFSDSGFMPMMSSMERTTESRS